MFKNELKKSMYGMTPIFVIFTICYFLVLIFSKDSFDDRMVQYYREYMETLEGELDYEKEVFIEDEYERVIVTMEINNELVMNGQNIDLEAMQYAIDHQSAFDIIYEKYNYLSGLESKEEQVFYYDLDWQNFFEKTSINYFEIFILIIVALYSITLEYYDERNVMIKTSYKGRLPYIVAKQNSLLFLAVTFSFVFFLTELIYMLFTMDITMLSLPVRSMTEFSGLSVSLSIGEYIIIRGLYHVLFCMVTVLIMCMIGLFVKRFQTGIFIGLVSMVIPLALRNIADEKYTIWIYSVHMSKDTAICTYGINGVWVAVILMVVIYFINLLLWCGIKHKF